MNKRIERPLRVHGHRSVRLQQPLFNTLREFPVLFLIFLRQFLQSLRYLIMMQLYSLVVTSAYQIWNSTSQTGICKGCKSCQSNWIFFGLELFGPNPHLSSVYPQHISFGLDTQFGLCIIFGRQELLLTYPSLFLFGQPVRFKVGVNLAF